MLMDAGDAAFGSRFNETLVGKTMNRLGYDAMALGNHEFDIGPERLAAFAELVRFPILASNVEGVPFLQDHVRLELGGGNSLCVLGVTAREANPLAGPGVNITDEVQGVLTLASRLLSEGKGCNRTVVLSHAGVATDRRIAREAKKAGVAVDAIAGGHSHVIMGREQDDTAPELPEFGLVSDEAFPLWSEGAGEFSPSFAHVGAGGRYVGLLRLEWADSKLTAVRGELLPLDANHGVKPDEEFDLWQSEMIGTDNIGGQDHDGMPKISIEGRGAFTNVCGQACRTGECLLGNLATDAMHACVDHGPCSKHVQSSKAAATIALLESGTLRSCVSPARDDFSGILPWPNKLVLLYMKGATVRKMLQHGVKSTIDSQGGAFLQSSGLEYRYENGTVREIWLSPQKMNHPRKGEKGHVRFILDEMNAKDSCKVSTSVSRTAFSDSVTYLVVVSDWLASGGDGFGELVSSAEVAATNVSLRDVILEHATSTPQVRFEKRSFEGAASTSSASSSAVRRSISGFLGGAVAFLVSYPIYTLFVRRSMAKTITCNCCRLFDGVLLGTLATAISNAIYFMMYHSEFLSLLSAFSRSAVAAITNSIVTTPFWVIVTHKQLTKNKSSTFAVAKSIYRERGGWGFLDSIFLNLLMCVFPIVRQVSLELIIDALAITRQNHVALAAAGASLIATVITYPIQKWRILLQSGEQLSVKKTSWHYYYDGVLFKLLDSSLKTFILFLVKEHSDMMLCILEG